MNNKDEIRRKILFEGLNLQSLCDTKEGQIAYMNDYATLDRFRQEYLLKFAKLPKMRTNYYVYGKSGVGKTFMSRALARKICQETSLKRDEDIFFEVGYGKTAYYGYDGQPILIWDGFDSESLLNLLGGYRDILQTFATSEISRIRKKTENGFVSLLNSVNIVNSIQPWSEFIDRLAEGCAEQGDTDKEITEYKAQICRRFQKVIHIK